MEATQHLVAGERVPAPAQPDRAVRRLWTRRHYLVIGGAGLLLGIMRAEAPIDTDTLWSARYGVDVLRTGALPHTDTYSWTEAGHTWTPNSWLWNVVLGASYRIGGIPGIWVMGILVAVATGLVVGRIADSLNVPAVPTMMGFGILGWLALVVDPRAQAVSNLIVPALALLVRPSVTGPPRRAVLTGSAAVALQVLWMNLHTEAVLGPVIVAAAGAMLITTGAPAISRRTLALRVSALVAMTTAACFVTPYGAAPVLHVMTVRRASVGLIAEWSPPGLGSIAQVAGLLLLITAVPAALMALRSRHSERAAVLAVLALAALTAVRFAPLLAIFLLPELAVFLSRLDVRPVIRVRIVMAELAVVALFIGLHAATFATLSDATASSTLLRQLPRGCRVVNDYQLGGAIILLRSDVRVSVDGRNDMYGRAGVLRAIGLLNDAVGTSKRLDESRVNCVLATNTYSLVRRLREDPTWQIVGADGFRTLLVRRST